MESICLLVADSDISVRSIIKKNAAEAGFLADEAADGITALKLFRRRDYAAILLDIDIPELDGVNVLRQIRKVSDVPVIIVTGRDLEKDRLLCYELGADDYVDKPFSPPVLMARIKVLLHRSGGLKKSIPKKISISGLFIDTVSRTVYVDDCAVSLTPKEYDLLFFLTQNPNQAFSRDTLLNKVWGLDFMGTDRTVDTHIKTLRESIKPYGKYISTVWGYGYKFVI